MAFSKALLRGMGFTDEQVSTLIELHMESVTALQDEVKAEQKKTTAIQKELDTLKAQGDGGWKEKYEKVHSDFESYKVDVENKKVYAAKEKAFRSQLKTLGVSDKIINLITKASQSDIEKIELDDKGEVKGLDTLSASMKETYADYITEVHEEGEQVNNPPAGGKGAAFESMSITEKMAYANSNPGAPEVEAWLNK